MISKTRHKIEGILEVQKRKMKNSSTLAEAKNSTSTRIQEFAYLVEFVFENKNWTESESQAFDIVELIRKKYLESNVKITRTDFGAGSKAENQSGETKQSKISDLCRIAASGSKWGRLMFKIIREIKPKNCLELGTSLGISGSYVLSALKLNELGEFVTVEGCPALAGIAEKTMKSLSYDHFCVEVGRFTDTLPNVLAGGKLYDYVFIDGHHAKQPTIDYFNMIYPYLSDKSIVLFDDISWSEGMNEAWETIKYNEAGILASFDLHKIGICLIDKSIATKSNTHYKLGY